MSSFASLHELLNTTSGMTVLRNNSGQDDGTDTVTGVGWFVYNGVVASSLYVNGNSWVGFGSSTEHLKICRCDGKMWYLYRQEGTVGSKKFLKIRWEGYTRYNYTSAGYALKWELFLFDDGGMYLNIIDVPDTSGYLGDSLLTYDDGTLTIPVALSTPAAFSLLCTPTGGFVISEEMYPGTVAHATSGTFECQTDFIQQVVSLTQSKIFWTEECPEGTSINVYVKLSGGEYERCINGGSVPVLTPDANFTNETLSVKIEMSTSDPYTTPTLSNLWIQVLQSGDNKIIVLEFEDEMNQNIRNAIGDVSVQYIGSSILGESGPALGFLKTFMPVGLVMKPHPNDAEHLMIADVTCSSVLTKISYLSYTSKAEHFTMVNASCSSVLTHIDDI